MTKPAVPLLLLTHYFPAHRGGIEIVAGQLARELAEQFDFRIAWMSSNCDAAPTGPPTVRFISIPCSNAIERRIGLPYPLWSLWALGEMRREVRAARVIHLHDFIYLPNLAAFLLARCHGRPVVITQHIGMVPYRNPLLRLALSAINRTIGRLVLARADQVIFISHSVHGYFARFTKFRRPAEIWPNGLDERVFHPATSGERRRQRQALGFDPNRPVLLFVGRFVEKKGLHILRELARALPGYHWLFAGWGPIHPAEWGLGNVRVLEGLSAEALRPVYQCADLLVLPSVGEGFPLVVQESMACGTPALVSTDAAAGCPAAAELLFSEPLGADSIERWAKRIRAILEALESDDTHRTRVAEFALQSWTLSSSAERYRSLLAALADTQPNEGRSQGG